ncbi:Ig-like domain-containing protein [Tautonia rosea]|uniref:hypothetical protein n=1 Tax=Tautonia rosea TaxID=2728037 RepID=UPI0014763820|nr:hypothetical protein [Tautonia rosea]
MSLARWIERWASRLRGNAARPQRSGLPALDRLESRELLTADLFDVKVVSASTPDSQAVDLRFEVRGLADGVQQSIDFGIYRSINESFDPIRDRRVGSIRVTVEGDGSEVLSATERIAIPGGLRPTPARPFVLAVADPSGVLNEFDTTNNLAGFRKRVLGVVTHGGVQTSSYPPVWAVQLSDALREVGYDAVITYTWAGESRTPGAAPKQGARLANIVLHASTLFPADEPVDLHLIGHSQGTVINSAALLTLEKIITPQLSAGFTRATMLDPHAASNGAPGQGSYTRDLEGWLTKHGTSAYQWMAGDPFVTIPEYVAEAEVYYQHTPVEFAGQSWSSNLWGQAPVVGKAQYSDLTGPGMAHTGVTGVQTWYYLNVVPTLAEGGTFVNPTALTGRLLATPSDRTQGDLTRSSLATPTYSGTAAPGGTIRLLTQMVPGGDFHALGETTVADDGSWSITTDELPGGHYRMIARGIVPAGRGPWRNLYPLLPLGRLAVRPGWDQVRPETLDHFDRLGTTDPPPLRRSADGPKGLPAPIPDRLLDRSARPPETFELSPGRDRLIARMAERLLTEQGRSGS